MFVEGYSLGSGQSSPEVQIGIVKTCFNRWKNKITSLLFFLAEHHVDGENTVSEQVKQRIFDKWTKVNFVEGNLRSLQEQWLKLGLTEPFPECKEKDRFVNTSKYIEKIMIRSAITIDNFTPSFELLSLLKEPVQTPDDESVMNTRTESLDRCASSNWSDNSINPNATCIVLPDTVELHEKFLTPFGKLNGASSSAPSVRPSFLDFQSTSHEKGRSQVGTIGGSYGDGMERIQVGKLPPVITSDDRFDRPTDDITIGRVCYDIQFLINSLKQLEIELSSHNGTSILQTDVESTRLNTMVPIYQTIQLLKEQLQQSLAGGQDFRGRGEVTISHEVTIVPTENCLPFNSNTESQLIRYVTEKGKRSKQRKASRRGKKQRQSSRGDEHCGNCGDPSHNVIQCGTSNYWQRKEYTFKNRLCFRCLKPGHKISGCHVKYVCGKCESEKHNIRLCTVSYRKVARLLNCSSSHEVNMIGNLVGRIPHRIILEINLAGHQLSGMIDTGASVNLIPAELVQELGLSTYDCQTTVDLPRGTLPIGQVVMVNVNIGRLTLLVEFLVSKYRPLVILGMDVFERFLLATTHHHEVYQEVGGNYILLSGPSKVEIMAIENTVDKRGKIDLCGANQDFVEVTGKGGCITTSQCHLHLISGLSITLDFLREGNFGHGFSLNRAVCLYPLHQRLHNGKIWERDNEGGRAFDQGKTSFIIAPGFIGIYNGILRKGIEAILRQVNPDDLKVNRNVVMCFLNSFSSIRDYFVTKLLAMKVTTGYWHCYLVGQKFVVYTKHRRWKSVDKSEELDAQLFYLTTRLQSADVDYLSRNSIILLKEAGFYVVSWVDVSCVAKTLVVCKDEDTSRDVRRCGDVEKDCLPYRLVNQALSKLHLKLKHIDRRGNEFRFGRIQQRPTAARITSDRIREGKGEENVHRATLGKLCRLAWAIIFKSSDNFMSFDDGWVTVNKPKLIVTDDQNNLQCKHFERARRATKCIEGRYFN